MFDIDAASCQSGPPFSAIQCGQAPVLPINIKLILLLCKVKAKLARLLFFLEILKLVLYLSTLWSPTHKVGSSLLQPWLQIEN
jgi:hypothetical protein